MNNRGWILSLVIVTAIIFGIAAYTALWMAVSRLRRSGSLTVRQVQARLAAQGGMAWAMQKLIDDPTWGSAEGQDSGGNACTSGPPPRCDLVLNNMAVDVDICPCSTPPCSVCPAGGPHAGETRSLRIKVVY